MIDITEALPPPIPLVTGYPADAPDNAEAIDTYPDGTDAVTIEIEPRHAVSRAYRMSLDDARDLVRSLQASIDAAIASDEDATFTERILDQRARWDAIRAEDQP